MRVGNEDRKRRFADFRVFAEERRAHAVALASVRFVANDRDREVNAVFPDEIRAGGNRIKPRHQTAQLFDERLRAALHGRKFLADVDDVARVDPGFLRRGIGVPEHFRELRLVGGVRRVVVRELDEFLRHGAERKFRRQRVAQRQRFFRLRNRDRLVAGKFVGLEHGVNELRRLPRVHAERVPGLVDEPAPRQVDFKMHRFLLGFGGVFAPAQLQLRRERVGFVVSAGGGF